MGEKLQFTELDQYLFGQGTHYDIYKKLGAHPTMRGRKKGVYFAVWAPNAMRVSVVGDFNGWDGRRHPMMRQGDSGVFSLFIPGIGPGELYKYEIKSAPQKVTMKTDPYGFACEKRPANASIVTNLQEYRWNDDKWLAKRSKRDYTKEPISMKFIWDLGKGSRELKMDLSITGSWHDSLCSMFRKWDIRMWSYCRSWSIH